MISVSFTVAMIPTAKGRPRFSRGAGGFPRAYTDPKTEAAESHFAAASSAHAPAHPFQGPVEVGLVFTLPAPKGWPNWKRLAIADVKHVSKPDCDNIVKLCLDSLNRTGRFWRDDSQVCRLVAEKRYGEVPQVHVTITELEQPSNDRQIASRVTQRLLDIP